jgi:hypothetical protein
VKRLTRAAARAELVDAMRIVNANRGYLTVWRAQWRRMLRVQRRYRGRLSLEPLLMLRRASPD